MDAKEIIGSIEEDGKKILMIDIEDILSEVMKGEDKEMSGLASSALTLLFGAPGPGPNEIISRVCIGKVGTGTDTSKDKNVYMEVVKTKIFFFKTEEEMEEGLGMVFPDEEK